ncbi:MAG TPA: hypothetical protein VEF34_20080 [Syntrophobacteraceae bacterium]|nr:hypothetical protein [Syntrophobacteraceae bacterium]
MQEIWSESADKPVCQAKQSRKIRLIGVAAHGENAGKILSRANAGHV